MEFGTLELLDSRIILGTWFYLESAVIFPGSGLHPFTKRLAKWCDTDAPSPLMTLHSDNAKLLADAVAWYD